NDVLPKAYGSTSIALPPRPNTLPALVAGKGKPNDGCPKVVSATTSLCECAGFQPLRRPSDCAPPMDFPSCAIASADSRSGQTAICFPQTSFNHPRTTIPGKHWGLWHRTPLSLTDRPPHSRGCDRVARKLAALAEHARSRDRAGIAEKHPPPK